MGSEDYTEGHLGPEHLAGSFGAGFLSPLYNPPICNGWRLKCNLIWEDLGFVRAL